MGKDIPLTGIFDSEHPRYSEAEEFRQLHAGDPEVQKVVETALGLENLKRQWGVHAAGVIMSSEPLMDHIPIMRREQDGAIITQFDYPTCETLGLLKMDFLGLRNLTVIDDALKNIVTNGKEPLDLAEISVGLDDKPTYELLARGDTLGVFQLDGGPMRSLLRLMRPDSFEDISAVLALYRPGPMGANSHTNYALRKNGQQPITPIHPELAEPLAEILDSTYGLIVYQEQVMAIAQKVAGYSLGKADLLRRAMGKKKREILDREFEGFREGMMANGYSGAAIRTLWDILVPFSDYAFNKAHTAGYGLVSYWTAYLKANDKCEYMAALLTSVRDDKDKSALYLNECRRMGIKVLPPDVNSSAADFHAVGDDIRFGLTAVRNVGANVVDAIVAAREEKGRYTSFEDFLRKVPAVVCNKRTIESLIKAGAFDSLGHTRRGLVAVHEVAVDAVVADKRQEAIGQDSLFGGLDEAGPTLSVVPPVPEGEWDKQTLLSSEREMLGLYVSDHPLFGVEHVLARAADTSIAALTARRREAGRRDGHDRRDDQLPAAQDDQERQPVGDRHRRGSRRRHRRAVLPADLPDRLARARRGPRGRRPRPGEPAGRRPDDLRGRADAARPRRARSRAGGRLVTGHPVHAAGRRETQGRARDAPRAHRGPSAAGADGPDDGDAARRRSARRPLAGSVRRPQGPARPQLPRLTRPVPGGRSAGPPRMAASPG